MDKIKIKKILIIFLLPFFIFLFLGCQKKEQPKKIKLYFVTWKPNIPEVWDEIYRIFKEREPNIELIKEIGPHSSTAFHDMLTQKLKNRSKDVDVFLMDVVWVAEFASAGWAMPLDDFFPSSEQKKFLEGSILANTYKGKIYGIPLFIDSGMLFYRKDLLEKYGFLPPKTWQDMVSQAEVIIKGEKKEGKEIYGFSGQFKQYEGLVCNMMEYILSNGGYIIEPQTGKIGITDTPAIEAVSFVRDSIIGKIAPKGVLTYEEPESLDLFIQGKVIFHRNWPYAWKVSNEPFSSRIVGKVGISKLPHFPMGKSYSTLGGWQVGISSFSKNKKVAWKFVKFLTSEEVQKLIAIKASKAPTRTALYNDPDILKVNPQFTWMKEVFITAYPRPRSPLYPAISNILQRYFSKVISNPNLDVKKEAETTFKELQKILSLNK